MGGGAGRVKTTIMELLSNGVDPGRFFAAGLDPATELAKFDAVPSGADVAPWVERLREFGVFFSQPLDLDWSMLTAYPTAYEKLEMGMQGPSGSGEAIAAVLGSNDAGGVYSKPEDPTHMRWYRYLFLNRGKPSTHLRVLATISDGDLVASMPAELSALVDAISELVR